MMRIVNGTPQSKCDIEGIYYQLNSSTAEIGPAMVHARGVIIGKGGVEARSRRGTGLLAFNRHTILPHLI